MQVQSIILILSLLICVCIHRTGAISILSDEDEDEIILLSTEEGLFIKKAGKNCEEYGNAPIFVEHSPFFYRPVQVNEASGDLLATLPGIGKTMAERIIQFRNDYGRFQNLNDLRKVNGLGDKKVAEIADLISF